MLLLCQRQLNVDLYSAGDTFAFILNNLLKDWGCSKPN